MISMGNVWDRTAEFLSDNLGAILPIALVGIFVPAVISANFSELQQGATPGLKAALGIGSLLLAIVSFWGQLAIIALALDPAHGRSAGGVALRRLPAALLVTLVILLVGLLATIPFGVILALNGVDLSAMSTGTIPTPPTGAAGAMLIYALLLIPLALWLFARLSVTMPAIVGERLALGALARSWKLTRGVALRIVGVIILYVVVSIVASSAAQFGIGSIFRLLTGATSGISIASVLTTIIVAAVSTAFTVLGTAFTAKLFVALLAREGGRHEAVRTQ
jgi:uncharacterized membrane protein YbaN (DUF454 family)